MHQCLKAVPVRLLASVFAGLAVCAPKSASAQERGGALAAGSQQSVEAMLADLRKVVTEQRALIDGQALRIDALEKDLATVKQSSSAPAVPPSVEARLAAIEQGVQRRPELAPEAVSAGEFPGSIRIPGTNAAVKLGGQVRMSLVQTLGPLGTDDKFVTSSIPVGGQQAGEDARTVYSPEASRFSIDLRGPFMSTNIRSFIEGDFAGNSNTFRLRHAFMQTPTFVLGQTWSTFSDPEAEPIGIDFEGLNAISQFRQPQVRYTRAIHEQLRLALALENPAPDLTGAEGVNLTPDFIARVRWEPKRGPRGLLGSAQHIQAAILARQLRGDVTTQPDVTLSTGGFGVNVSGVLVPRWARGDFIKFSSNNGWGIGRYITDLDTLGGQDAVYDPVAQTLRALPVASGYIGYEKRWRPTFISAITYGIVSVSNLDIQPDDALRRTQRTSFNVTWSPVPQTDIAVEFLLGTRVNKNGQAGTSSQLQAGWIYRF